MGGRPHIVYFQQYKKRAKAKGKKKCHTETMRGRKSLYNLYNTETFFWSSVLFFRNTPQQRCENSQVIDR